MHAYAVILRYPEAKFGSERVLFKSTQKIKIKDLTEIISVNHLCNSKNVWIDRVGADDAYFLIKNIFDKSFDL